VCVCVCVQVCRGGASYHPPARRARSDSAHCSAPSVWWPPRARSCATPPSSSRRATRSTRSSGSGAWRARAFLRLLFLDLHLSQPPFSVSTSSVSSSSFLPLSLLLFLSLLLWDFVSPPIPHRVTWQVSRSYNLIPNHQYLSPGLYCDRHYHRMLSDLHDSLHSVSHLQFPFPRCS